MIDPLRNVSSVRYVCDCRCAAGSDTVERTFVWINELKLFSRVLDMRNFYSSIHRRGAHEYDLQIPLNVLDAASCLQYLDVYVNFLSQPQPYSVLSIQFDLS